MNEKLEKYYLEEDRKERLEHRDVLLAIASILNTAIGTELFSYLFKNFSVTELPEEHLEGKMLYERLGVLKAGNSIYKLACEAAPEKAASILAKLERERYDKICREYELNRDDGINEYGSTY